MRVILRLLAGLTAAFAVASIAAGIMAANRRRQVVRVDDPELDEVQLTAFFEPLSFQSRAGSFRGGTVELWYGGGIIDLRGATLDPGGAVLTVRAIFGGCQVIVPESWPVETHVRGIGGAGDTRSPGNRATDGPSLTVEGVVVFGGFGISSEVSDEVARGLEEAVAESPLRRRKWRP